MTAKEKEILHAIRAVRENMKGDYSDYAKGYRRAIAHIEEDVRIIINREANQ